MKTRSILRSVIAMSMALGGLAVSSGEALAAASEAYNWKNVRVDGGGFIPGIIFNRSEANLIYARTDMGGAYRWDATNSSWIPLLDWVGWDNWGWNGVLSMATDAVDPNRVYAAVGMYTNGWDPTMGAILRSTDRGATWKSFTLPFHIGGNMPGRGMGERLAIDPNKNSILYFGADGGNGLWRSTDSGATWSQVSNFPNVGNYAQDPTDINNYLNQNQGVVWVTFDPSTGSSGAATQAIYVGVADKDNSIYRSLDGGVTWGRVAGQPTGFLPHKGIIDSVNGYLYIATSDTGGPYDGGKGDVWKYQISTGTWTNISPVASTNSALYYGYSGLTIDRQNPKTLLVASVNSWWPDAIFYRTTDGGATWSPIWTWGSYPSRDMKYTLDIAEVPWLNFGNTSAQAPETSPKLAWMNESLEIDPFNSNRMMYGTGATIYSTDNLKSWDTGGKVIYKPTVKGLEEVAVLDLASPPTGAPLYSGVGDVGGFRHDDLTKVPSTMFTTPVFGSTTSIDFAELSPSNMVRVSGDGKVAITSNAGSSWWAGNQPSGSTTSGNVAMSANGGTIVWSTGGTSGVLYSTTAGSNWIASTGVPAGASVEADRVNPSKFYAVSGGTFYVSTNGGVSFTATFSGLPASLRKFKAVFGKEGDIWLAGGSTTTTYGLWHSTNSGTSFTKIANVQEADNVTFGKAAPSGSYPAIYIVAKVDGVRGVYRSTDAAATWVRINDDQHQYGNLGEAVSGDQRVYGRLYLGTNGRGILYGDSAGVTTSSSAATSSAVATSSSVATTSATATSSSSKTSTSSSVPSSVATSTSSSVKTSTSSSVATSSVATSTSSSVKTSSSSSVATSSSVASSSGTANSCTYVISSQWSGGFNGAVRIKNNRTTAINGWTVSWTYSDGSKVTNAWNATVTGTNPYTATNMGYNGTIAPGQSVELGFGGSMPAGISASVPTVTGAACN